MRYVNMNVRFFLLKIIIVSFLLNSSCSGDRAPLFRMNLEADLIIPAGLNSLDTYYFTIPLVPTNFRTYWGGNPSDVQSILPANAQMFSRFSNIDWNIVREVYIFAVSPRNPDNRKEIFYQNLIERNRSSELRLFNSLPDVRDLLVQDFVNLEVRINFRVITPFEIDTRLIMNFHANAE